MKSYYAPVDSSRSTASPHTGGAPAGRPTAVVIGSGFGGLAAAIRMQAQGWQVTVVEKLSTPGGRATVHRQDGFTFDAGPTIITAPFMLEELWQLAGRRLADDIDLRPMDPFYRIRFDDGTWFDYSGDPEHMRREVARFAPQDVDGYARFLEEAAQCYRLGFEELGSIAYDTLGDLLKAVPSLVRMRGWRSIYHMVSSHLSHPKLRLVMSFHPLLIGGNPMSVTCVYSLINILERRFGVHWAMGGTGRLVEGMVDVMQGLGATLRCNAEVARIDVQPGGNGSRGRACGVVLASGERIPADVVVSNADTMWTYRKLIEPRWRRHWTDERVDKGRYSMSLFVWYFGTRKQFPDVPHHQMLMGPRYEGLLNDIFKRQVLAKDFSLYLHRPTATDAAMAPPGCDAWYVLSPVPHLGSGTDWTQEAPRYRDAIAQVLEDTVMPGFRQHIVTERITTPQHFQDNLLAYRGAAFGLEPLLLQSAWFRPHNRSEDVDGLYMVGAGTHPGAGIPGVLMSAQALMSVLPPAAEARAAAGSATGAARAASTHPA